MIFGAANLCLAPWTEALERGGLLIFALTHTPTITVVCFRWVLISGSIVLYMILLGLQNACYCGRGGNHLLDLPLITAINAMVLSRLSVGGVLYLACITLLLASWPQHDITSIAKWRGQASSWLLAIWRSFITKSYLGIQQSWIVKNLLTIWRSFIAQCMLAIWQHPIAKQ